MEKSVHTDLAELLEQVPTQPQGEESTTGHEVIGAEGETIKLEDTPDITREV